MISAAILGGSGYTGKYLLKYCSNHINVDSITIYAKNSSGKSIYSVFPDLVNEVDDGIIKNVNDLKLSHDIYFLALPHGESSKYVSNLIDNSKKVIDLGADYRLDNVELYNKIYKTNHPNPLLLENKNYGLAEQNHYYEHNLIANPGCYPTAALLSSLPLVKEFSSNIISIDTVAYSGISGAGKKVDPSLLFAENYNNVKAYNIGSHRHEVEICQEINKIGISIDYSLSTHLLPIFSGIYSTSIFHLSENVNQFDLNEVFKDNYYSAPFIRLRETPPELKWVLGTNYCDMNAKSLGNKIIVTAAIDNLVKGAAGQAIQNMNKLFNWDETLGINIYKESLENV